MSADLGFVHRYLPGEDVSPARRSSCCTERAGMKRI